MAANWVSERHDVVNPISVSVSLLLCLIVVLITTKMKTRLKGKVPPGEFGWPLLGETLEFLGCQRKGSPAVFFDTRVQKYGDVFTTHLVGHPTVVFCGADGNRFLFANENKLVQSAWPSSVGRLFGSSVITTVGDDARRLRKILMTFLGAEALHKFIGRMDSITRHHLVQHWLGQQEVTVYPLMKKHTFAIACDLFASIEDARAMADLFHNFTLLCNGVLQVPIDLPGTRYRKAKLGANAIRQQLTKIIEERRIALENGSASAEQDLLSFLLCNTADGEKSLTDDEIKDNILLLLYAGHDTSSSTVTSLLKFLAENPHCYDQVLQEQLEIADSKKGGEFLEWEDLQRMKYSWRVVQETLRLQSPVQGAFRLAIKDFTYTGFTIPKGWKAYWTVNSTHFKTEHFSNPEKFDPSRFEGAGPAPYTFVPFGGGPRMCPGNEFARMEVLVFLHNIVKNFRWRLVDSDEKKSNDLTKYSIDELVGSLKNYEDERNMNENTSLEHAFKTQMTFDRGKGRGRDNFQREDKKSQDPGGMTNQNFSSRGRNIN